MSLSPLMPQLNAAGISLLIISHKHHSHPDNQDMLALALARRHTPVHRHAQTCTFTRAHGYRCGDNALMQSQSGGYPDGQNHLQPKGTLNLILRVIDLISQ